MFLPLTSHNPVPSHTWNCQQIVDQRLKVLRIFRSKFVYVDPTDSLWTPAWGPNQGCSGGGWEKKGQEKSENEASKYWAAESEKKSEGSSKLKEGLCVTQARWCIEWTSSSSSCVSNPFFFLPYSVLLFTSFVFKTWWLTVKEVFLFTSTWLVFKGDEATLLILMSNWPKCALHTMSNRQYSARLTASGTFSSLGF